MDSVGNLGQILGDPPTTSKIAHFSTMAADSVTNKVREPIGIGPMGLMHHRYTASSLNHILGVGIFFFAFHVA